MRLFSTRYVLAAFAFSHSLVTAVDVWVDSSCNRFGNRMATTLDEVTLMGSEAFQRTANDPPDGDMPYFFQRLFMADRGVSLQRLRVDSTVFCL